MRNKFIGIFDSGFGGLDILQSIVRKLPEYNYIYLGDSVNAPYGDRPQETIHGFTKKAVDFLFDKDCGVVILACNTASSESLRKIQQAYGADKKVLGVLIPAAEEAVKMTKNKKIGVMATEGTVRSGAFERELKKVDPQIEVFQQACPLLVPIVESGEQDSEKTEEILKEYLQPLLEESIDTLILGCTHFGILKNKIKRIVGEGVYIIGEGETVPKKLTDYLRRHLEIEKNLAKEGARKFYTTGDVEQFNELGSRFFGQEIKAEKVGL